MDSLLTKRLFLFPYNHRAGCTHPSRSSRRGVSPDAPATDFRRGECVTRPARTTPLLLGIAEISGNFKVKLGRPLSIKASRVAAAPSAPSGCYARKWHAPLFHAPIYS